MTSTQGVKFKFSEGEKVLCYEPDLTKARVLYDSKVLEVCVTRDGKKRKSVEYLIHFSGWSNTWDRCVSEEFILKDNEENRNLQMKLAAAAAVHLRSKKRSRLPEMFRESLNQQKNAELDDDWKVSGDSNASHSAASSTLTGSEEEDIEDSKMIELDIPSGLKKQLEDDYYNIKLRKKLVKLPSDQTVNDILECYVNTQSINVFHTFGKSRGSTKHLNAERNSNLCKEVMHGLRIYFDFTLPLILLYDEEKTQFDYCMKTCKPTYKEVVKSSDKGALESSASSSNQGNVEETGTASTKTETSLPSDGHIAKRPKESSTLSDSSSLIVKSGSQKVPKRDRQTDESFDVDCPKRVLRSSICRHDPAPKCTPPGNAPSEATNDEEEHMKQSSTPGSKEDKAARGLRNQTARSTQDVAKSVGHSRDSSPQQGHALPSPPPSSHTSDTSQLRQVQPPEPVQISNNTSSVSSSYSLSDTSTPPVKRNMKRKRESKVMNKIAHWTMTPSYVYEQTPPPPSLIYGPQHLLRLFVKLPELIQRTSISDCKLSILLRHLEAFLRYLDVHQEDLFFDSAYEDAIEFVSIKSESCADTATVETDIQR